MQSKPRGTDINRSGAGCAASGQGTLCNCSGMARYVCYAGQCDSRAAALSGLPQEIHAQKCTYTAVSFVGHENETFCSPRHCKAVDGVLCLALGASF